MFFFRYKTNNAIQIFIEVNSYEVCKKPQCVKLNLCKRNDHIKSAWNGILDIIRVNKFSCYLKWRSFRNWEILARIKIGAGQFLTLLLPCNFLIHWRTAFSFYAKFFLSKISPHNVIHTLNISYREKKKATIWYTNIYFSSSSITLFSFKHT